MRNNSKKLPYYLDGFIEVYRPLESNVSTFGAKKNTRKKEEMQLLYKLPYTQTYKRVEDIDFAESQGKNLTLKIKVPLVKNIRQSDNVLINNILYDVIYTDEDRFNQELYIYLEEVREIE